MNGKKVVKFWTGGLFVTNMQKSGEVLDRGSFWATFGSCRCPWKNVGLCFGVVGPLQTYQMTEYLIVDVCNQPVAPIPLTGR